MNSKTKSDVAEAAMNLVDMVTSSVETSQLSLQNTTNEHLVDIKKNLAGVEATLSNNKETIQQLDEIKECLANLENKMDTQQKTMEMILEGRMQRIEFALQNLSLVDQNFKTAKFKETKDYCGTIEYTLTLVDARDLVRDVLLYFHKNMGMFVSNYVIDKTSYSSFPRVHKIEEEWKSDFRNELANQLEKLLGQKPRYKRVRRWSCGGILQIKSYMHILSSTSVLVDP